MHNKNLRGLIVSSVSGLLLVAAGSASAFEMNVNDTTVKLYGYAKLDVIYDVDSYLGNSLAHSNIRLDDVAGSDGTTRLHAFQSRLGVSTVTPTSHGDLKTTIEGDFYGSGGGTLRLRHAYGEWNGILAGQTWTNFSNFLGTTPTLDFTGQVGQTAITRQAQLRYTTGGLSAAIEAPGTIGGSTAIFAVTPPAGGEPIPSPTSDDNLPDFTIQYKNAAGPVAYATSAVIRQISVYDVVADSEEDTLGYGVSLSAKFTVSPALSIQSSVVYGEGIGGYMYSGPAVPGVYDDVNNDIEAVEALGGTLGATLKAGPGAFSLAYGIATADYDDAESAGLAVGSRNEMFQSIFANYIWSPIANVTYGVEAGFHSRETVGGAEGDAVRLQGMAMYSF